VPKPSKAANTLAAINFNMKSSLPAVVLKIGRRGTHIENANVTGSFAARSMRL
jgi:hypothetical protein